jgi:hypothetical protein
MTLIRAHSPMTQRNKYPIPVLLLLTRTPSLWRRRVSINMHLRLDIPHRLDQIFNGFLPPLVRQALYFRQLAFNILLSSLLQLRI